MKAEQARSQAGYSIGVAARMTGISSHTLRMWERRYGLGPSRRSAGGQREFTVTDIDHLKLLKRLTNSGMRIGDIAQLPMKTLSSLLQETSGQAPDAGAESMRVVVVGASLGDYFRAHNKRFPRLDFSFDARNVEDFLRAGESAEGDLLILQMDVITPQHLPELNRLSEGGARLLVFFRFASRPVKESLAAMPLMTAGGSMDAEEIDQAVNKALRLRDHLDRIASQAFDVDLPAAHPRQFSEEDLIEAEHQANRLNCECPSHLSALIRQLSAFEEYSRNCEVESWQQAAVHACIYSYTNQARYLIEKALAAVMDE